MELFYPDILVRLGQYTFTEGVRIEVYSSKDSYFDWGKVMFTQQFKEKLSLDRMSVAQIFLGYNGNLHPVFSGYVAKGYDDAGAANEILLKDDMLLLEQTYITNTFLDATPQEIITFCLAKAGIHAMELTSTAYVPRSRIAICQKNVIAVLEEVKALWGIRDTFFFTDGVFHWGTKPKQATVYQFEHAQNIISLTRMGGQNELETVSVPFIRHTHSISVSHPQVKGIFEVNKIVFTTNDAGFIRTQLTF